MVSTKQFKEDLRAIAQLHTDGQNEPKILSPNTIQASNQKMFSQATIQEKVAQLGFKISERLAASRSRSGSDNRTAGVTWGK